MDTKITLYKIKEVLTPSGYHDNGLMKETKEKLLIPYSKFQEAIVEECGFKGFTLTARQERMGSKNKEDCDFKGYVITIDGQSWNVCDNKILRKFENDWT